MEDEVLENFVTVTGVSKERARFFLDAANGNLQAALGAFYEDQQSTASGHHPSSTGGFATISDYRGDEEDTEDSQKYYAGGSEHSGQLIAGPPKKKAGGKELAKEVFEAAKKQGAANVEEENVIQKSSAFQGTGFRLGDSEGPSQSVAGKAKAREKVRHILTFWSNGFTVDDGPLRNGESPTDQQFLRSVSKGEIPQELLHAARGGEVDINIEDHRTEEYRPPPPKVVAFSGTGHKLGSFAPQVVSHEPAQDSPSPPPPPPPQSVLLDSSQPTTSIQIRLADGTRLVAKFNHSHTVNDLRQFINLSRPSMSAAHYVLMTTFPNKELTDLGQTLDDAKLLNAVIVQRMK